MAHGHGGGGGAGGALQEFFLSLGLDADGASFAAAELMVKGLEKALELVIDIAKEIPKEFAEMIVSTAEYSHAVEHASEMTGRSTESIQEMSYASQLAGLAGDTLQNGFVHLAKAMGSVRDGSMESARAFARLGVHALDSNGKLRDQEVVFGELADAIAKLPPGAERSAAAVSIFGKAGAELVPILKGGAEGLRQMREEAQELGAVMSPEAIEQGAEFAKNLTRLKTAGEGLVHDFAEPFIEVLNPLIDSFIEWVKANRELISTKVKEWAQTIITAVAALGGFVKGVVDNFWRFVAVLRIVAVIAASLAGAFVILKIATLGMAAASTIAAFAEALFTGSLLANLLALGEVAVVCVLVAAEYAAAGLAAVGAGISAAAAWVAAAAPMIIITTLLAAMILGFQDLFVFLEGGDSLIGSILNRYADKVDDFWETMKAIVLPWWFTALFGNDAIDKVGLKIGDAIRGNDGSSSQAVASYEPPTASYSVSDFVSPGAASPSASAQAASGGSSSSSSVDNSKSAVSVSAPVTIQVTAAPGQSNADLASGIEKHLDEHLAGVLRQAAAMPKD